MSGFGEQFLCLLKYRYGVYPDSKVHGANMESTWVLSDPDGPHVGPMYLAIRVFSSLLRNSRKKRQNNTFMSA